MRGLCSLLAVVGLIGLGCGDDTSATGGSGGTAGTGGTGGTAGHGGSGGSGGTGGSGGSGGIDAPMIDAPMNDGEVDGGVDGNPNDITGTFIEQYVTDTGVVPMPIDLSAATPTAVIGTMAYTGTGAADGSFVIPNVPMSTYTLRGLLFLVTNARVLDLGFDFLGRSDAAPPSAATSLALSASSMDNWGQSDIIEVYSSNAGTVVSVSTGASANTFTSGTPATNDTSLTNATINWFGAGGNLIQHSKGDSVVVLHEKAQTVGGINFWATTRTFSSQALEMAAGNNSLTGGTFAAAPTAMATFAWSRSQFAGHIADMNLGGGQSFQFAMLQAQPAAATRGWLSAAQFIAPDLLMTFAAATANTDVTVGPLTYGNPFGSTLDVIGIAGASGSRTYTLSGTTTGSPVGANMVMAKLRDSFLLDGAAPIVTPPQMLKAGNVAANVDLTLGSLTPTLSWTAPAIGTPQLYTVTLIEATASGTTTSLAFVRQYRTTQTSVTIPMNHLTTGHHYIFQVKAQSSGGDLTASPNRLHLPYGEADTLSGILTAP